MPGSKDDQKVEVIEVKPDSPDLALCILIGEDGRVRFNGKGSHNAAWIIEMLSRLVEALRDAEAAK